MPTSASAIMTTWGIAGHGDLSALVRFDPITAVMLALVALVGWVVTRFSSTYLDGDPHQRRYQRRLLATLAAVTIVAVTNDLLVLVLAWTATSISLHGLLTFFGDRPVAVAVAHKKFLLARCADACMLGAVMAFALAFHTLRIDGIAAAASRADAMPPAAHVGIALVAFAVLLKSAQLPFHGWLIQVMEAPTPVSALLHAGIVNLGGFVLLRLAPVVDRAPETQTLLVVVGVVTALLASLVMTTRVSVKVSLAWSTCAQMGFMLMQCGLGLWEMALLHLVAHSLYKAYAFLSAGDTVRQTQRRRAAVHSAAPTARSIVTAALVALTGTAAVAGLWERLPFASHLSVPAVVLVGVIALALVPLTAVPSGRAGVAQAVRALGVPVAYLALHEVFGRIVEHRPSPPAALVVFVAVAFVGLFVVQSVCRVQPHSRWLHRSRPWIYSGLFLDDAFTRVAFRLAPPPAARERPTPLPVPRALAVVRTSHAATVGIASNGTDPR